MLRIEKSFRLAVNVEGRGGGGVVVVLICHYLRVGLNIGNEHAMFASLLKGTNQTGEILNF